MYVVVITILTQLTDHTNHKPKTNNCRMPRHKYKKKKLHEGQMMLDEETMARGSHNCLVGEHC